jgi:hypothetical protein
LFQVGCDDGEAFKGLDPLQQVAYLGINVPVDRMSNAAARAPDGVAFVPYHHGTAAFSQVKRSRDILGGFADIFTDQLRQVDHHDAKIKRARSTSAASVLPVPLGPANNAATPRPRMPPGGAKPQLSNT